MNENSKKSVAFAAIDQFVESNIVLPTEKVTTKDFVEWGQGNKYPFYLLDLFNNVTTLHSIISGNIDFIAGDSISILPLGERFKDGIMNAKGDTISSLVRDLAKDYNLFGGFALQVIRDFSGAIAEVYYIDLRFLRSNKENDVFYYNESWNKGGRKEAIIYPRFMPSLKWETLTDEERNRHASSILFVKNVNTQVYPAPLFAASVKACEIERAIDDYHLNAIYNGLSSSAIVNFNNGDPGDEVKREIEADFNEKFSGHQNAGRVMFSWNPDRLNATTITEMKTEDFGAKYEALSKHSRQQIFSAFRAVPLLFGLTSEANTGFSTDEFQQSFKLYNRTQIRPAQGMIADAFDTIYGMKGVLTIKPFSIEGETETNVN